MRRMIRNGRFFGLMAVLLAASPAGAQTGGSIIGWGSQVVVGPEQLTNFGRGLSGAVRQLRFWIS